jgi:hypothetical protein
LTCFILAPNSTTNPQFKYLLNYCECVMCGLIGLHQVKELMKALEDAERARMELEDEYARVRANLLEELSLVKAERDAFREKCEVSAGQRQRTLLF